VQFPGQSRRRALESARFSRRFGALLATVTLLSAFTCLASSAKSQSAPTAPADTPRSWVESTCAHELHIIDDDGTLPLSYRERKIDAKGDTTREIIETRQGSVARLLERNGQPITAAEDTAERQRLSAILASPSDFIRHHKRDTSIRDDTMQVVRLFPQAMIFTYVPGQPQQPGATSPQVVIDFHPDPAFKPPTMFSELLTGIEGRIWIDTQSHRLTRIEGRVLRPVNFGFGLLARIYPGGTIELEQTNVSGDRWVYSRLVQHLTLRAMMVKTIPEDNQMSATDFHLLPKPLTFQEAIQQLLATPIPLR
jgi:hypothetical protein